MSDQQVSQLDWLVGAADRLAAPASQPADLLHLLQVLRVELVCSSGEGPSTLTKPSPRTYRIILTRRSPGLESKLSPSERFSVAHELGHVLLDYRFGIRPSTARQYHLVEDWCNLFARRLLLPRQAVAGLQLCSWSRLPRLIAAMANQYVIPVRHVGYRLAEQFPQLVLARTVAAQTKRGDSVQRVSWSTANARALDLMERRHITGKHLLGTLLTCRPCSSIVWVVVEGRELRVRAFPQSRGSWLLAAQVRTGEPALMTSPRMKEVGSRDRLGGVTKRWSLLTAPLCGTHGNGAASNG